MANPNTAIGLGTRKNFATLGDRNFEPDQTNPVQYACNHENLEFLGTIYQPTTTLPFDAVGNTQYGPFALRCLQLYWDQGWITPLT